MMRFVVLLVLLSIGCQTTAPRTGERAPSLDGPREGEYQAMLERYTRHAEIYQGFDTRMFIAVTYQSWAFRQARILRRQAFQGQSDAEVATWTRDEKAESESEYAFLVGAHFNENVHDDLDRPKSIWRISLSANGEEVLPLQVERISRASIQLKTFYPYLDEFWVAYRLRFARLRPDGSPVFTGNPASLNLHFASVLGKVELTYPAE